MLPSGSSDLYDLPYQCWKECILSFSQLLGGRVTVRNDFLSSLSDFTDSAVYNALSEDPVSIAFPVVHN